MRESGGFPAPRLQQFQVLVDLRDGNLAFTRGRRDPLDRVGADVAGGKDAGAAGLVREAGPVGHAFGNVRTGQHVALLIHPDEAAEPRSLGRGADEDAELIRFDFHGRAFAVERQRFQQAFAVDFLDHGLRPYRHLARTLELGDEVLGHGVRDVGAAHQHHHLGAILAESDGGLARGVGAADDVDLLWLADVQVVGEAVADAAVDEDVEVLRLQAPVRQAVGQQHGLGVDVVVLVLGRGDPVAVLFAQALDLHGAAEFELRELARLVEQAVHQLLARDPIGESRVVADHGAHPGLSARVA